MRFLMVGIVVHFFAVAAASAQMRITEWMYSGLDGEYIEFTNVGGAAIDMTGWSFDDDSNTPGSQDLSAFGVVLPGESVILTEEPAAIFTANWSLPVTVDVIGDNANNLGRNDQINIYDNGGLLVDRLTYGDQNFPGTVRTQNVAGIPSGPALLGANDPALWQLAALGDAFGSHTGLNGDIGNPGIYVPEPTALSLLLFGGMAAFRRR